MRPVARAWVDRGPLHSSLELAADRHDDGWAVWEQSPLVDSTGKPVAFLGVEVPAHLAFYRACIASVTDEDLYAGLLVSMHGSGIYRQRYGTDPDLKLANADAVRDLVEAFVVEQRRSRPSGHARPGWRTSCAGPTIAGCRCTTGSVSTSACATSRQASRRSHGPRAGAARAWRVRMTPFPFGDEPATFTLKRRLIPKQGVDAAEFRRDFWDMEAATMAIEIHP